MNILHRRNLGFLYDICQIITCKTAKRENWIEVFVKTGHESADIRDLEQILAKFDDVDPSLLLFGYRERKKESLIVNILIDYANEYMTNCDVLSFTQYLGNIDRIKDYISQYYLGCDASGDILKVIATEKNLSADLKSFLYEFYLFPEQFVKTVIDEVNKIVLKLQKYYLENLEKLLDCQENFNYNALENVPFAKKKRWEHGLKNCYVSFSLISKYAGLKGRNEEKGWMILGCELQKGLGEAIETEIDIAAFGNAFGDKLRVKIVEEIVKNGEMTLADMAKSLGVVNTIAIYHLDVLKKENLMLHRYQGRKVLYCLNSNQIAKGLTAIKALCNGEET